MFRRLTDLGYQRTPLQAVGFYLAYFVLLLVGVAMVAAIYAYAFPFATEQGGVRLSTSCSIFVCAGLSLRILRAKHISAQWMYIVLLVVSIALAWFTGALGGLLPAAFLSNRPASTHSTPPELDATPT